MVYRAIYAVKIWWCMIAMVTLLQKLIFVDQHRIYAWRSTYCILVRSGQFFRLQWKKSIIYILQSWSKMLAPLKYLSQMYCNYSFISCLCIGTTHKNKKYGKHWCHRTTANSQALHMCLMGYRSGLVIGHFRIFRCFIFIQLWVMLEVWKYVWGQCLAGRPAFGHWALHCDPKSLYFMIPWTQWRHPVSATQPQKCCTLPKHYLALWKKNLWSDKRFWLILSQAFNL